MKLLLKRQVRVNVASKANLVNKARVANMLKVATDSRKPANSKFIHLSAIKAYQRQKAWKLNVRKISKIQFALV
ncbi:MAG: hypothetical protein P8J38_05585 [Thermodesulfobacteriota bacteirum]|nr:hypothetical protein [Thermodesulfobacteriota bacterium]